MRINDIHLHVPRMVGPDMEMISVGGAIHADGGNEARGDRSGHLGKSEKIFQPAPGLIQRRIERLSLDRGFNS